MEYGIAAGIAFIAAIIAYLVLDKQKKLKAKARNANAKIAARPTVPSTPGWVGDLQIETQGQQGAWLEVSAGPQIGRTFFVGHRTLTLGRGTTHPIQISDRDVSRSHCRVVWDGSEWSVTDMGSGNGTWVNDTRTTAGPLVDGDLLRVGGTTLLFHADASFQVDYTLARKEVGGAFETATRSVDLSAGGDDGTASMKDRLLEISRLTQAARKGLSGSPLLEEISISLRRQLGADRAVVLRWTINKWDLHSFHHAPDLSRDQLRIPPDKPLMSRVARAGESMGTKAFTTDEGLLCALATPIRRGGVVIGVLYADRVGKGESEFQPPDLEYLESLAALVEQAIPEV